MPWRGIVLLIVQASILQEDRDAVKTSRSLGSCMAGRGLTPPGYN